MRNRQELNESICRKSCGFVARVLPAFCIAIVTCFTMVLLSGCSAPAGNKKADVDYAARSAQAIRVIDTLSAGAGEITFSEGASASEASLQKLQAAMQDLARRQAKVAFVVVDLKSGKAFASNTEWRHVSQSCIKAPYISSVLVKDPSVFQEDIETIEPLIRVSDGDCYDALYQAYGSDPIIEWAATAGLPDSLFERQYPRYITVTEFAKLWALMYAYLNNDAPDEFVSYFQHTKYSALDLELGKKYLVQSKAGWENGNKAENEGDDFDSLVVPLQEFVDGNPLNDETATNDAGIVYSANGDYLCVFFSTIMSSPPLLQPLVSAIDEVHSDMVRN